MKHILQLGSIFGTKMGWVGHQAGSFWSDHALMYWTPDHSLQAIYVEALHISYPYAMLVFPFI